MTTPEIKDLILPLEQYMTPDQKAELERILSIGKKWKELGDERKKNFRSQNKRKDFNGERMYEEEEGDIMPGPNDYTTTEDKFTDLLIQYPEAKKTRIEKYKDILESLGYFKMNVVEKDKFEKEFMKNLILYAIDYRYIFSAERPIIKTFEELGQYKSGTNIDLFSKNIGNKGSKILAEVLIKTGGLRAGTELDLRYNKIGDDGAKSIAEAIFKTGGLKVGSKLVLQHNEIGEGGAKYIAEALEKTGGLKEGSELNFNDNKIGDDGAIAIAEAIAKTGGLKEGTELLLGSNIIGDIGLAAIYQAIVKTGGLKEGTILKFRDNQFGNSGEEILQKLENESRKLTRCYIEF